MTQHINLGNFLAVQCEKVIGEEEFIGQFEVSITVAKFRQNLRKEELVTTQRPESREPDSTTRATCGALTRRSSWQVKDSCTRCLDRPATKEERKSERHDFMYHQSSPHGRAVSQYGMCIGMSMRVYVHTHATGMSVRMLWHTYAIMACILDDTYIQDILV